MAILADFDLHGIDVSNSYLRIERLWGGKPDGNWYALVRVYKSQSDANYIFSEDEMADETVNKQKWYHEFNTSVEYLPDVLPYELLYSKLKTDYDGIDS